MASASRRPKEGSQGRKHCVNPDQGYGENEKRGQRMTRKKAHQFSISIIKKQDKNVTLKIY